MGQPKLLLPWPSSRRPEGFLIDQVLEAWTTSQVDQVVVVVREDDDALVRACARWPVQLVRPRQAPADMKASVQLGLRYLEARFRPSATAGCFVAPADLPHLSAGLIDTLIQTPAAQRSIVVPTFGERPGHPALLPWGLTSEIFRLAADEGVDRVVKRHPHITVEFPASAAVDDIDTPQEYREALAKARRLET